MKVKKKFLITVGREYGSGGKVIAEQIGKDLDIKVYDKNLIEMIAKKHDLDKDTLVNDDERLSNPFFEPYINYGIDTASRSSRLFALQSQIIREEANEGPAIFLGRCADDILWEYPDVIRIFIYAPKADRVERIMNVEGISESLAAEKIIRRMDKQRKAYYQFYTDKKWGTPEGMDFMINSSALGIDGTVKCASWELYEHSNNSISHRVSQEPVEKRRTAAQGVRYHMTDGSCAAVLFFPADCRRAQWKALTRRARRSKNAEAFLNFYHSSSRHIR